MDKAPSRFWPEISNPRTPCSVSGDVRWHEGSQFTEVSLSLCDAQIFSGATPSDTGGDRCRCVAHFHLKVKVVLPPIKGLGESFVMSLRTEEKPEPRRPAAAQRGVAPIARLVATILGVPALLTGRHARHSG
jgi:hypothetical protein